ncbi:MAG: glutathione S-transferase [Proteobacteria bacterium]|nr:glutathione S-transferase [Pseudomonadota bacterium]
MHLIGMLDSPYVRRVAVALQLLGLRFSHQSLSVFRTFDAFRAINPVVKAPTFVCDDGTVLMDSTLIIHYAERVAHPRTLEADDLPTFRHDTRVTGLALAACEKSVQIIYERALREPHMQLESWMTRVTGQMLAACDGLEAALATPHGAPLTPLRQAGLTTAVAWHFIQQMVPASVPAARFPRLAEFSAHAETLPAFAAAPHGEGLVAGAG